MSWPAPKSAHFSKALRGRGLGTLLTRQRLEGAAPLPLPQTALRTRSKLSLHPRPPAQKESRTE